MTDVTKNITEISKETNTNASTHKKRSYRDIPLLIFIVAFAIFVMLGCTLITDSNQVDNMLYEENLMANKSSLENTEQEVSQGTKLSPENDRFDYAIATKHPCDYEVLPDGKLKVWFEDGTVDVFGDGNSVFRMSIVGGDEDNGAVPLNEEQAVEGALKHAEAADGSYGISAGYNYYTTSTYWTGSSVSTPVTAYDQAASASVKFTFTLASGSTWYNLRQLSKCDAKLTCDSSSTSPSYTINTHSFVINASASADRVKCEDVTATAKINTPKLTLTANGAPTPSISITPSTSGWSTSKSVTIAGSVPHGIRKIDYEYYASDSSTLTNTSTGNVNTTSYSFSKTTYGRVKATAYTTVTKSATAEKSKVTLMLDNEAPSAPTIKFYTTSSCTTEISGPYSGNVYIKVTAADKDTEPGTYSLITQCTLKNVTQNYSFTTQTRSGTAQKKEDTFTFSLTGDNRKYANGTWTATVTDAVSKSTSNSVTYSHTDWKAPEIVSYSVSMLGSAKTATYDNSAWTNKPLIVTMKLRDNVGDNVSAAIKNELINKISINQTYLGTTETLTYSYNASSPAEKGIHRTTQSFDGSGSYYYNATFTFPLPYDFDTLTDSTMITIQDKANNTTTVSKTALRTEVEKHVKRSIDTIAPQVNITPLSGVVGAETTGGNSTNRDKDVNFSLTVVDFAMNSSEYFTTTGSGNNFNNGSGLKCFKIFTDTDRTTTIPFYCNGVLENDGVHTVDHSNMSAGVDTPTSVKSYSIVIPYDKLRHKKFYVVAYDFCDNASDGSSYSGTSYSYYGHSFNRDYGATATGEYYVSQNMNKSTGTGSLQCLYYINKDYYAPQIVVKDKNGNVIASTNRYMGSTFKYTFPWSSNLADQTFYIDYYYGYSGGRGTCTGNDKKLETTVTPYNVLDADVKTTTVTSGKPSGTDAWSSTTTGVPTNNNVKNTTYKVKPNVEFTIKSKGINTYTIYFANNENYTTNKTVTDQEAASAITAKIEITTQIDYDVPDVNLLGFYLEETSDFTQKPLYTESQLVSSSNWISAKTSVGQGLWAVFTVHDELSGIVNAQAGSAIDPVGSNSGAKIKRYGKNGTSNIISSDQYQSNYKNGVLEGTDTTADSGYVFAFRYGEYTSKQYGYAKLINGVYYVAVKVFSLDEMRKLGMSSKIDINGKQKEVWDIQLGTYLEYTFAARDFVGNSNTYCSEAVYGDSGLRAGLKANTETAGSGSYVLRYYVDPFPVYATVNFYTIPKTSYDAVKNYASVSAAKAAGVPVREFTREVDGDSIWAVYDMCNGNNGTALWTKDYIIVEVNKINSLSAAEVFWGQADYAKINDISDVLNYTQPTTMYKSTTLDWIVFQSEQSKNIKFGLRIVNATFRSGDDATSGEDDDNAVKNYYNLEYLNTLTNPYYMLIKQDTSLPELKKVYFSDRNDLKSSEQALLTFDAKYDAAGNYYYVLNKEHSSAYVDGQVDPYVWSKQEVYIYFVVTDTIEKLSGSGADVFGIQVGGTNDNPIYDYCTYIDPDPEDPTAEFVTYCYMDKTWGCKKKGEELSFNFVIRDNMANETKGSYSGKAKLNEGGSKVFKLFPIVDGVQVISELTSTNPAYTKSVSSSIGTVNVLKGTETRQSSITVNVKYTTGISGVQFYLKETNYLYFNNSGDERAGSYFEDDLLSIFIKGGELASTYNFAANGWGHYEGGKFVEGAIAGSRIAGDNEDASKLADQNMSINISMTSLQKRLYLLAVSGTGSYYVIDLGNIFIDIDPVQFDPNMTIFTVESSASTTEEETYGEMAYANMQTIWTNVVGNTYTNGKVYIYYQLFDDASGINDDTVLYNNNTKLEKILVTDIPVWYVDGEPTNVRVYDINGAMPTVKLNEEYVVVNGMKTKLLSSKVSSSTTTIGYIDEIYYRLLISETADVTIDAKDMAGNEWDANSSDIAKCGAKNTTYSIRIDSAPITVQSTTYYSSTNREYKGSLVDYTNDDVVMEWRVDYGSSGFGYLAYTITDNFQGVIDQYSAANSANVPKISIGKSGTIILEYIGENGKAQKYDTHLAKTNTVTVKAEAGYWKVNNSVTPIKVANMYYGKFGNSSFIIDYSNNEKHLKDTSSGGLARTIYDYLDIPNVNFDANGNILLTYLDYKGDLVQIDTGIAKRADNNTKLTTMIDKGVYYWAIVDGAGNKVSTGARVSAEPIYPNSVHDVTWLITGSGSDAIIEIIDDYDEVYAELRIPTIKYDQNNKIVLNYYNGTAFEDKLTNISKPSDSTVTIVAKKASNSATVLNWFVEGMNTGIVVNTAYYGEYLEGKTWEVNTASNYLYCTFIIGKDDLSLTYSICAYNNVSEEYATGAEEKDIVITFVGDDKIEVEEYEGQQYNTSWNIVFGSQTLTYVDYQVIDDKGNLFTNRNIKVPTISFSSNNTIIVTYVDTQNHVQSYDTGLYATKDTITLTLSQGACKVDNQSSIPVNASVYSTSLEPTWVYDFKANTITLKDNGVTGLARNTFTSVFGSSVRIEVNGSTLNVSIGGVASGETIQANTNGMVTLKTKKTGDAYYWYVNDKDTKIAVSNDYPTNYYDVVWSWNAKNSSDYRIIDNIDNTCVRMRVPTLTNENNKIKITYLLENGKEESKDTLIAWSNNVRLRADNTTNMWVVSTDNGTYSAPISSMYSYAVLGTTWEYDFANNMVKVTFPVAKNNANVNYIIKAANDLGSRDFNRPVSDYVESIISIDVTAPIIDTTVGNIAELNAQDVWHALAKSLRVSIYDGMSGMGISTQACDVIDGEAIYYENAYIEIGYNKLWLVKCDDGLYRAYNGLSENINGVPVVRTTDLYYLDQHTTYKLVVFDKAGNTSEYNITPKVDVVTASVTNLTAYDSEGNKYEQGTPATKWLQDTGISTINWTDNYVYVTMDVTYGESGYALYVSANYKKNVNGGLDAVWTKLATSNYEKSTRNNGDGTKTDTIKYYIGEGTEYLYNYYMFRALSDAQNTELNVYKSYTNSSKPRATETGNSAPNSTNYKLSIELESYEAADQGMQYAEISIGKRSITELIAIDKTTPSVTVSAQDVRNSDYGNRYNANKLIWEVPDGKWVNASVTMTVSLESESGYISGNALYYRSYAKDLSGAYKWSEWTMVLPTGRIYVLQDGKWTQQSGASIGITVEGKVRYYNKDGVTDETVTISNYANVLKYSIDSSTNNVVYEYYTETGAGKISNRGTIGRIDGNNVYGIKIDTNTPNVSASGKATYDDFGTVDAMNIQDQLKSSFSSGSNLPYVVTANASWTYYNTVVMGFAISNVGYSGVTIKLGGEDFDVITYEQYLEESKALGSSSIYRYYYVGNNGETNKTVSVDTFAGTKGTGTTVYARIDNTTPIVYVSGISGTKATNWGWNDNLYTNSVEYWYVSETAINLGVGIVENNVFTTTAPYSGYEIEYQVNGSGEWLPVAGDVLRFSGIGDNVINGNVYKFRITSGAGLYYYIGEDIINNYIEKNNEITFHKQNIVNTIATVAGVRPVQSHVISGHVGGETLDLQAEVSAYQMFVDANRYSYTYNGRVYLGKDYGYDINTNNFMSYTVDESDSNGNFSDTIDTQFHRGDVIEFSYEAKHNVVTDDSYSGNGYNYFHDYTVGSPDGTERIYCADEEKAGKFRVQFVNDHVNLIGYFIAEVRVYYGDKEGNLNNVDGKDVFYKQTADGEMVTTGEANYVYTDGTTVKSVSIALDYQYFRYNENTALSRNNSVEVTEPTEVGAYYVHTTARQDGNNEYGNFRITNENSANGATDYKDFVIKYFAKPVHVTEIINNGATKETQVEVITDYYLINNVTDFYYVDNNYYNIDENGNVTPMPSSYLACNYILNTDLEIDKRLEGVFTGTFNANGSDNYGYKEIYTGELDEDEQEIVITEGYNKGIHTITILTNGVSDGTQSVFDRIEGKGTVKNLEVVLSDVMVISVESSTNVGILASAISGSVYNVSVRGDIVLDNVSTTVGKVNVGGLAGIIENGAKLGLDSDIVYVDVRINNNGDIVKNANVSTLAGYVGTGAIFNNVQVFGEITVYNVDSSVKVGTVYGDADAGYYNGSTMNYLANNAFLNDYTVSGASSSSAVVGINGMIAVDYAAMANNDTVVAGKAINDMIIDRLYSDFGYSYNGEDTAYGIGTVDSPLVISTVEQLMAIDNYMNLSFVVDKTVKTLDMSEYDATVAIHKVFNGTFDTEDKEFVVLNNFAGNVDTFDGNYFGLFGQLNGQVNNVVFGDIAVDFTYEGSNALYAGLVAGKIYQDAVINNIVLIGTQKITSTNGAVYAGGIVGSANGGRIYDVFSMNNISVNGSQVVAGGIAGNVNNLYLYNDATEGAIYLLGRVEGNASSLVVGSAIGSGMLAANASNVYAIKNNTYNNGAVLESKPIGSTSDDYGIKMVEFIDSGMRSSSFASGKNAFNLVFSQYYPLQGNGTANSPFIVESAEDFDYINIALYANYSITKSITFTEFTTIGEGLVFSGSINGSGGDNISAEESSIASLSGLDAPLVYNSTGSITNISLNIIYENTVKSGETFYFGAVAVYNSGTIKNVTVAGSVDITSEANDTTLYVSGFVGVNYGGDILLEGSEEQISKIQNSISALNITINGGGTAYVGGYAGVIEQGQPKFSYGLATGTITVTDVQTVYAGLFAGASYGECEWVLGEAASIDYTYTITVDGVTIPKTDENGDPIVDNFYGVEFIK